MIKIKDFLLPFFGLFTSISTILCCALPIILVMLGMGSVFATLSTNLPFVIYLAEKVIYLFIISGFFLVISGYFIFAAKQSCPTDKRHAEICDKTKKFNKIIWWISLTILLISLFFKYILILLV